MRTSLLASALLGSLAVACGGADPASSGGGGAGGADAPSTSASGGGATTSQGGGASSSSSSSAGGGLPCPADVTCVETGSFVEERDTSVEGTEVIDAYACAPETNEGGPEILYRVWIPGPGYLSAAVYDGAGDDIDLHLLTDLDLAAPTGASCVARGDVEVGADVEPGYAWIVADTWVNGSNTALTGPFTIEIGFAPASEGPCTMQTGSIARVGDGGEALALPATGPVALEAHLVTQEEPAPFPESASDELDQHYALSLERSGVAMRRTQTWAPLEGGGTFYGAGVGDPADLPALHEAWYVTMAWTPAARPAGGTRMILRRPDDPSRAVVVAAGYETGPSSLQRVGGAPEEVHRYLGTGHDDPLVLGFAADGTLPVGPRRCTD